MKIEAGKYYRTRGGDVVGPMAAVPGCDDTFTAIGHTWNEEDGFFVRGNPYKLDLISEVYVSDAPPAVKETEKELREMMRDPRYWQKREPEWVKRVTDGFRALVGGDTPPDGPNGPFRIVQETKTLRDELVEKAALEIFKRFYLTPESAVGFDWMWRAAENFVEARKK
jgi:hypothetical protein